MCPARPARTSSGVSGTENELKPWRAGAIRRERGEATQSTWAATQNGGDATTRRLRVEHVRLAVHPISVSSN